MIHTEEIHYRDEDTICHGFLAYNKNELDPKPCVMVAHDWGGRHETVCEKAKQLAALGYVGFAIDMYGQAKLGGTKIEKRALMTPLRQDRKRLTARVLAAFHTVAKLPQVNNKQIAAIGYCFGGLVVLDLARSGIDVKGVVSFHGVLSKAETLKQTAILAKILVLHGYDDPLISPEEVDLFAKEMTEKTADWQIHLYGLTAHSFTDPTADDDEMGLHYNQVADRRSWNTTEQFLKELFTDV